MRAAFHFVLSRMSNLRIININININMIVIMIMIMIMTEIATILIIVIMIIVIVIVTVVIVIMIVVMIIIGRTSACSPSSTSRTLPGPDRTLKLTPLEMSDATSRSYLEVFLPT